MGSLGKSQVPSRAGTLQSPRALHSSPASSWDTEGMARSSRDPRSQHALCQRSPDGQRMSQGHISCPLLRHSLLQGAMVSHGGTQTCRMSWCNSGTHRDLKDGMLMWDLTPRWTVSRPSQSTRCAQAAPEGMPACEGTRGWRQRKEVHGASSAV